MSDCTCGAGNTPHMWSCPQADPLGDILATKKKIEEAAKKDWAFKWVPKPKHQDITFDIKKRLNGEFYLACRECGALVELPNGEPGYATPCLEAREHCETEHPDLFDDGTQTEDEVWDE